MKFVQSNKTFIDYLYLKLSKNNLIGTKAYLSISLY